jgi:putative membrane protein insertion efficiency factor
MLARIAVLVIRFYQMTVSRLLGNVCRFEPSCSRYAVLCLEEHGLLRGVFLSARRLCKCHPFHKGGYDPPPPSLPMLARDTPCDRRTRWVARGLVPTIGDGNHGVGDLPVGDAQPGNQSS